MKELRFRDYLDTDRAACLRIFDANSPEFFAPNEQADYLRFLNAVPLGYRVCVIADSVAGAFGVLPEGRDCVRLHWILLDPAYQGRGLGARIMAQVVADARSHGAVAVLIAASHKSAPFFERFGAIVELTVEHGWGADMHRIDMRLPL